ncbi:hypothetical protein ACTFIY_000152 [Dictyostelium cf. discoideum]
MLLKSLIITLYLFNFLSVIALLVLSFSQISSKFTEKVCTEGLSPSKIVTYNDKATLTLECAWKNRSSIQRIIISFIIIIDLILLVSTIIKKSKINYWLITLFLLALGVGGFYTSIYDSIIVKDSKKYCEFLADQKPDGYDMECEYKNFYATLGVGFITATFTILSSVLSLRYTSKILNQAKPFFNVSENSKNKNLEEGGVDYNKLKKQHEKEKKKQEKQEKNSDFFKEESINSENLNNTGAILSNSSYPSFSGSCSDGVVPYRAISTVDGKEIAYFQCGWTLTRSFVRILLQFLILIAMILLVVFYTKKNNSKFLFCNLALLFLGVAGFYSFIADASSLKNSYDYCDNDSELSIPGKECQFGRFFGTLTFNILTTFSVCFISIFIFIKRKKLLDHHNNYSSSTSSSSKVQSDKSRPLSSLSCDEDL